MMYLSLLSQPRNNPTYISNGGQQPGQQHVLPNRMNQTYESNVGQASNHICFNALFGTCLLDNASERPKHDLTQKGGFKRSSQQGRKLIAL